MAPGSYLVTSHFQISRNHLVGTQPLTQAGRELSAALEGMPVARSRSREQITSFFGDMTLLEPGLTDVWAWRPDTDLLVTMRDVLAGVRVGWNVVTSLGCVGRKECPSSAPAASAAAADETCADPGITHPDHAN